MSVAACVCEHEWHMLVLWCCEWLVSCMLCVSVSVCWVLGGKHLLVCGGWQKGAASCLMEEAVGGGQVRGGLTALQWCTREKRGGLLDLHPADLAPSWGLPVRNVNMFSAFILSQFPEQAGFESSRTKGSFYWDLWQTLPFSESSFSVTWLGCKIRIRDDSWVCWALIL